MTKFAIICRLTAIASLLAAVPNTALTAEKTSEAPKPYDLPLSDTEKVGVIDAVKGYVYAKPPTRTSLKVFDSVKGDVVTLEFKNMLLDKTQGGCAARGAGDYIAVCAEFTSPENESYVLIFVVKQQTEREEVWADGDLKKIKPLGSMIVRDVIIGSVNGVKRQEFTQDDNGVWHSKPANVMEGDLPAEDAAPPAAP